MSSENRSSSAVRNLRSLFENKTSLDPNSPDVRGRSPSGSGSAVSSDKENSGGEKRPTSNVRASFVPVELAGSKKMAAATADSVDGNGADLKRESSAGLRRGSFSGGDGLSELRKTVSAEQDRIAIPETAVEVDESLLVEQVDKPPANPDKPVTGAEEEPSEMKPPDPKDADAVSGGEALPPVTEDLRQSTPSKASPSKTSPSETSPSKASPSKAAKKPDAKKPRTNGKPAAISTKASSKASSSTMKSPVSQPKTPISAKSPASSSKPETPKSTSRKAPTKKASRISLTAPTAASMAHTKGASDKPANSKTSPTSRPKPREVTRPVNLPSHLTAPTASSRARHDPEPASTSTSTTSNLRSSTTSRPKPHTSSARQTPRSSLAPQHRPESRGSQTTARRSIVPADGSFLERMMRPTASSASKTHEKVEANTPPKTKDGASKLKVNGHPTKPPVKSRVSKAAGGASVDEPHENFHDDAQAEPAHAREPVEEPIEEAEDGADVPKAESALAPATYEHPSSPRTIGSATDDEAKTGEAETTEMHTKAGGVSGNETPIPHTNGVMEGGALEATPAGLGGEETIR